MTDTMKIKALLLALAAVATLSLQAQTNERYIEVTGTSEIEIVPDKIHYIIEIREYFEEEFDGHSKPEDYHTRLLEKTRSRLLGIQEVRHHTDGFQSNR